MLRILMVSLCFFMPKIAFADAESAGGNDFRQAAREYLALADDFDSKGDFKTAGIYRKMASIKNYAASLADQGKWEDIDWGEYHALSEQLYTSNHDKLKK